MRRLATYPLKILTVIENLGRGGAEQALVYLLPALQARGFHCEVAALWPPYFVAEKLEAAGIPVHRLDISPEWNLPRAVTALARLARIRQFDVIHAHLFFAGFYSALCRPLAPGAKYAVTFHNLGYEMFPANNLKRKLLKAGNRLFMKNLVDRHVAVSRAVAHHYSNHLGLDNIVVLPNAIDVKQVQLPAALNRTASLVPYGVQAQDFVLLMAGRFSYEKGHRFLLEALKILRDRNLHPHALLLGQGPLYGEMKATIQAKELSNQVTVVPALPHDELMRLMQAVDILVMPSTLEGFPLTPAEAMLLRKPVIATTVGGLPELIENNVSGVLVPPADPEALARAIELLMTNSDLRNKMGEAGRQRVLLNFTLDALIPKWEGFYAELCKDSR